MSDMGELVFLSPLLARFKRDASGCSLRTIQVPVEQIDALLASGEVDMALGAIRAAPDSLYQRRLYLHSFHAMVSARNTEVGDSISLEQFEAMGHIVVSLTGRSGEGYDRVLDDRGVRRKIAVITPHFLTVPVLLDRHPDLIATVPRELGVVFEKFGVRTLDLPVQIPPFQISQYWHARFHHDPAVIWLRDLVKQMFENFPIIAE